MGKNGLRRALGLRVPAIPVRGRVYARPLHHRGFLFGLPRALRPDLQSGSPEGQHFRHESRQPSGVLELRSRVSCTHPSLDPPELLQPDRLAGSSRAVVLDRGGLLAGGPQAAQSHRMGGVVFSRAHLAEFHAPPRLHRTARHRAARDVPHPLGVCVLGASGARRDRDRSRRYAEVPARDVHSLPGLETAMEGGGGRRARDGDHSGRRVADPPLASIQLGEGISRHDIRRGTRYDPREQPVPGESGPAVFHRGTARRALAPHPEFRASPRVGGMGQPGRAGHPDQARVRSPRNAVSS